MLIPKMYRPTILLVLALWLGACDPWFSYSPYESRLEESYIDITAANLALIRAGSAGDSKPFNVALVSDTHYHYANLDDAIADINQRASFDFVVVTGDITDNGLKQEFVFFHESMKKLTIPYVTVIGNHDYLSNGEDVYSLMFGDFNYTFVYNNVKFVLFDNVLWESEKVPDFAWLAGELSRSHQYDHVLPLSHIPPTDGQMAEFRNDFHDMLVRNNVRLSIHGHSHKYTLEDIYGDGILYHTVPTPQDREYSSISISADSVHIEKISY